MLTASGLQKQKNGCSEQKNAKKMRELLAQRLFLTANYSNYSNAGAGLFWTSNYADNVGSG